MLDLEREIFKLEAENEIQNLMGSYSFLLDGRKYDELLQLFAIDQIDVRVELGGVYQGYDSLVRLYAGKHYDQHAGGHYPGYEGRGNVAKHPQNTPLVVVGDDLKTAKGIWISTGFAFFHKEGKKEIHWGMFRYGADFIYEHGTWKIWHMKVYNGIMSDGDRSWSNPAPRPLMPPMPGQEDQNGNDTPFPPPPFEEKFPPDFPSTSDYQYNIDTVMPYEPPVPNPYFVFDITKAN